MDPISSLLINCRRLFLRNYVININIGVHDFEKHDKQSVLINIDVYIPLTISTPLQDNLSEVVDYDFMREVITRRIAQGHINLQETLCDDIARMILVHPTVVAVRVSTAKPDIYSDCEAVGVEVFHLKSDKCESFL